MKIKTRAIVSVMLIVFFFFIHKIMSRLHPGYNDERISNVVQKLGDPDKVDFHHLDTDGNNHRIGGPGRPDPNEEDFLNAELERLQIDMASAAMNFKEWPWKIAAGWVSERQIYPKAHPELALILYAMANAKIIRADVLPKGTQLKLLFVLEGGQRVVFKQKRYERDFIIEGKPYDGFDRHNGEIAAFHLDRVFDFRRSPITMGRIVNLREEVIPVATEKLKNTFLEKDGNLCYYGVCYYCKKEEKACADGDVMEGSITLWLPDEYSSFEKLRHPYQRTYMNGKNARWETDGTYCDTVVKLKPPYDRGTRLLDIADACVFDYLIGNADRHHYEVFKGKSKDTMLLMIDNAKSFGNPYWHEPSILAPLRQCCILRNSTWVKLLRIKNGILTQLLEAAMESDPISPVLHSSHLRAMNERLPHIITTIQHCMDIRGKEKVLVNEWKGLDTMR